MIPSVLNRIILLSREHGHDNSYERQHLTEACLQSQWLIQLTSWQELLEHTGRLGDREVANISTSGTKGRRKKELR